MGFQFGIAKKFTDKDVGNILIVKENQAEPKEQVE